MYYQVRWTSLSPPATLIFHILTRFKFLYTIFTLRINSYGQWPQKGFLSIFYKLLHQYLCFSNVAWGIAKNNSNKTCSVPGRHVGRIVVRIHSFLTSAPDVGERSTSHHNWFVPLKETRHPFIWKLGGPQSRSGHCGKDDFLLLPGFDPRAARPWPS